MIYGEAGNASSGSTLSDTLGFQISYLKMNIDRGDQSQGQKHEAADGCWPNNSEQIRCSDIDSVGNTQTVRRGAFNACIRNTSIKSLKAPTSAKHQVTKEEEAGIVSLHDSLPWASFPGMGTGLFATSLHYVRFRTGSGSRFW